MTALSTAKPSRVKRPQFSLFVFAVPAIAIYGAFFVFPTLRTLWYGFMNWQGPSTEPAWVGLENYKSLIDDSVFRNSVSVSLKFMTVVVLAQVGISLFYSVKLVKNTKTTVFLRALYFFPTILASTSVAFIWAFVYDPASGLVRSVLDLVGLKSYSPSMLGSTHTALYFLVIVQIWFHIGQMILVFVAGLQQIPSELLEAASIDGATRLQVFWKITWPLLAPATAIVVAYTTFQTFRSFELVYNLTEGGPADATRVLSFHIYRQAFEAGEYGLAAAQSVVFMVIVLAVTFLQRRALRLVRSDARVFA
jgi:raffinose/stachyose/melibiose transport system permease protein